jgi:hypothetical protein
MINGFENVCETCPLRQKVNIEHADESLAWGSEGVIATLHDGVDRFDVTLTKEEINDSDQANAALDQSQRAISGCEGARRGLLRKKCGAGLASAWRWSETTTIFEPSVHTAEEIVPLLGQADYRDAMPHFEEPTWLVGDPQEFSELNLGWNSAFMNVGIKKLTETVRGTDAELRKGKAVMLDHVSWPAFVQDMEDVYRIRIAQGGLHFAFRSNIELKNEDTFYEDLDRILAEGIFTYINSDTATLEASKKIISAVETRSREHRESMSKWLTEGGLERALQRTEEDNG